MTLPATPGPRVSHSCQPAGGIAGWHPEDAGDNLLPTPKSGNSRTAGKPKGCKATARRPGRGLRGECPVGFSGNRRKRKRALETPRWEGRSLGERVS